MSAMWQGASSVDRATSQVPTIIFHGDRDATVHPRNGDAILAQSVAPFTGLRMSVQRGQVIGGLAYSRTVHADHSGLAVCEHWAIHGAGHAWAGGSERDRILIRADQTLPRR